jgi:hypothetical protein
MPTTLHKNSTYDQNHAPHSFEVADQTALDALTPTALDVKKIALKLDDDTYYRLESYDPIVWTKLGNVTNEQLALKQDILSEGAFVDGDKTKLDFITTTEDINLDTLESFRIQTEQKFTDTNEPTGFIREFKETIGYIELCTDGTKVISVDWNGVTTIRSNGLWVDGTNANAREFAITPVPYSGTIDIISEEDGSVTNRADTRDTSINGGEYYSVYIEGTKLNITTQQVVTLPNQSGLQFIYHDINGGLALDTTFSFDYFEDRPITATVYGNATTQELVNFGDERHGIQMDGFTHRYLHFTQGTQYVSGMGLNGVTNGSTTYTSIDSGKAYDEDIYMSPLSQTSSPFVYRDGEFWTVLDDGLEIAYLSGGVAQFNCDTNYVNYGVAGVDYTPSGSYELRDVTGNDRMIMFFVLTNNKEFPYVKILGQKVYTNSLEARADVGTAVNDLILSGLPSPEFLPIYAIIVDDTGAVDDLSSDEVYVDLRGAKISGSGSISGVTTSHGDLTGREVADQHPISAITDLQNTLDGKVTKVTSTDNAIVRFDGTTGDVQDSGVIIDDSNNLTASGLSISGSTPNAIIQGANIVNQLKLQRDISTVNGRAGMEFRLGDSASATAGHSYAGVYGRIKDNTNGAEDGELTFYTSTNGTLTEKVKIDSAGVLNLSGKAMYTGTTGRQLGYSVYTTDGAGASAYGLGQSGDYGHLAYDLTASEVRLGAFTGFDLVLGHATGAGYGSEVFTPRVTIDTTGNLGLGTNTFSIYDSNAGSEITSNLQLQTKLNDSGFTFRPSGSSVEMSFDSINSASKRIRHALIDIEAIDDTAGSESNTLNFYKQISGTLTKVGSFKADGLLNLAICPTYADDTAAGSGGLAAGDVYKSSDGILRIKL